jgi:hypothetical protein
MPYVKYFASRAASNSITGADAVDLLSSSTRTVGFTRPPPHPHAHIYKDGFVHALTQTERNDMMSLESNRKRLGAKGLAKLAYYHGRKTALQGANQEGLHLDPLTRGKAVHLDHQIVDPVKKGKTNLYIDRGTHSQFEDSEVAVMALVHVLNTAAGEKAMQYLTDDDSRVTIVSKSAANMLNARAPAFKNLKLPPSAHPLRKQVPQLLERSKGNSGAALVGKEPFGSVVSVFDRCKNGVLLLVTHFPKKDAVTQDDVTYSDRAHKKLNSNAQFKAKTMAVPIEWSAPPPGPLPTLPMGVARVAPLATSANVGVSCVNCGLRHGRFVSVWNVWFKCDRCGDVYCPDHKPNGAARWCDAMSRPCPRPGCSGRVRYLR